MKTRSLITCSLSVLVFALSGCRSGSQSSVRGEDGSVQEQVERQPSLTEKLLQKVEEQFNVKVPQKFADVVIRQDNQLRESSERLRDELESVKQNLQEKDVDGAIDQLANKVKNLNPQIIDFSVRQEINDKLNGMTQEQKDKLQHRMDQLVDDVSQQVKPVVQKIMDNPVDAYKRVFGAEPSEDSGKEDVPQEIDKASLVTAANFIGEEADTGFALTEGTMFTSPKFSFKLLLSAFVFVALGFFIGAFFSIAGAAILTIGVAMIPLALLHFIWIM